MDSDNILKGLFTQKELLRLFSNDIPQEAFNKILVERARFKAHNYLALNHDKKYKNKLKLYDKYKSIVQKDHDVLIQSLVMQIQCAQEIGEIYSGEVRKNPKRMQLQGYLVDELYAQCILIANEIYTLVISGFPEGAVARWRSLHESSVNLQVLLKSPIDISIRYWDFAEVSQFQESKTLRKMKPLHRRQASKTKYVHSRGEKLMASFEKKYGKEFLKSHGWAKPLFPNANPSFAGLEEYVGLSHHQFAYKTSSTKIHAGPMGLRRRLHLPAHETTPLVGPSNYGLFTPVYNSCLTLWITANKLCLVRQTSRNIILQNAMHIIMEELHNADKAQ